MHRGGSVGLPVQASRTRATALNPALVAPSLRLVMGDPKAPVLDQTAPAGRASPGLLKNGSLRATPDLKTNILLVDDRADKLLALEAVLSSLGQNLVQARSGKDA